MRPSNFGGPFNYTLYFWRKLAAILKTLFKDKIKQINKMAYYLICKIWYYLKAFLNQRDAFL